MIADSKVRSLIERYVKKGLNDGEVDDLLEYCQTQYKFLLRLTTHLLGLPKPSEYNKKLCYCPPQSMEKLRALY